MTLLGIAGATLMPSTLALIVNMFRDDTQRGVAIAVWATCQFAGAALGPVLGGLLLERFWWGSVFLLAVPLMVVLVLVGPVLLPEHRNRDAGRLDLTGVALSLAAILPIVYGIKRLVADTTTTVMPIAALVVGTVCGVVFVRRKLWLDDPLLDLRLLSQRSLRLVLTTLALAGVVMAGTGLLVTQYLQTVLGYSPAESALWFAPMGLAVAVGVTLTPVIARSVAPQTAIAAGRHRPDPRGARRLQQRDQHRRPDRRGHLRRPRDPHRHPAALRGQQQNPARTWSGEHSTTSPCPSSRPGRALLERINGDELLDR
ncbi:MFS transporter, DHA2 family, multidrug resistance protein [Streptosporangium subroseum]|uniref:MFS transporter, DHA2 family, multidrug resistance protein n=1 Tax=Streptosporangium subroseum TaxID=106412 RepID=A0A239JNJ1_9ACTN|nr:MFS transporter [Streptosporangium subroseum]SNT07395.1 MFS transporter, DHA2 family, multidrug resistance protein [Streptosporangium subroseum]